MSLQVHYPYVTNPYGVSLLNTVLYSLSQCDCVEFDVQLSREEVSIIFHDFTAAMRGRTVSLYAW